MIIDDGSSYLFVTADEERMVTCPKCGAPAGKKCTPPGRMKSNPQSHIARVNAALNRKSALRSLLEEESNG